MRGTARGLAICAFAALLGWGAVMPAAIAQTAETRTVASSASIDRLLTLTGTERTLQAMHAQIDEAIRLSVEQSLQGQKVAPDERQKIEAMLERLAALYRDELSWEKMQGLSRQVYGESFTQDEIDGLIAFYQSPTGRAFVAKMPLVMQKSMALMQERMGPLMVKVQAAIVETMQELTAKEDQAAEPEAKAARPVGKAKVKPRPSKPVAKRAQAKRK